MCVCVSLCVCVRMCDTVNWCIRKKEWREGGRE